MRIVHVAIGLIFLAACSTNSVVYRPPTTTESSPSAFEESLRHIDAAQTELVRLHGEVRNLITTLEDLKKERDVDMADVVSKALIREILGTAQGQAVDEVTFRVSAVLDPLAINSLRRTNLISLSTSILVSIIRIKQDLDRAQRHKEEAERIRKSLDSIQNETLPGIKRMYSPLDRLRNSAEVLLQLELQLEELLATSRARRHDVYRDHQKNP